MSISIFATAKPKDPAVKKDYGIDWTAWLAGDTIASSVWEITSGGPATLSLSTFDDTRTKIWVEGGVNGDRLILTNHITTAGGRSEERSILIPIRDL